MKHASAMRGNGWWPTIASRLSSLNTCFPVCLDTSFKVFGVELGPESSARRSSSAGFRSRAPGRASAVVHLHALLAPEQLHPFSAQSLTDLPLVSAHVELALAIHLQHPGASRVLPRRRLRIVALAARPPSDWLTLPSPALRAAAGGCVPSGTRPPLLRIVSWHSQPRQRPLQLAVKVLHLALRMPHPAPVRTDPLPHQPQRQRRQPLRRAPTPPRHAMVHQHRLRHPQRQNPLSNCSRTYSTRALPSACNNPHPVAAVIVQHRQWTDRLLPAQPAFEVHLPQLIGLAASKRSTAGGWRSSGCTRPRRNRMRWMVLWVRLTLWPCNSTRNLRAPQSG